MKFLSNIEGGLNFYAVEVDFGSFPVTSGSFTIDALPGLTPGAPVFIQQANGPYTGKGSLDDDSQMDSIAATAYVLDSSTIKVNWCSPTGPVYGNFSFNYLK